jgi:hypothetical protein
MEREALRRAEKMRGAFHSSNSVREQKPKAKREPSVPPPIEEMPKKEPEKTVIKENRPKGFLDLFNKDKESTLLLMLIIFLYEDNADPTLLMALVYLLIA